MRTTSSRSLSSWSALVALASLVLALALAAVAAAPAHADDAPMRAWMKSNMGAARASGDFAGLEGAFQRVAASVPDAAWSEWATIARQGAAAAKAQDMRGVKESCSACHQKYKDEYKARFRARAYP